MSRGRQKGSKFERDICRQLSLWWTNGKREDVFWRTSGSGNRATVRGRVGKRTSYQSGDICATDPIGSPLMDLLTIELKRGYSKHTIADLLDAPQHAADQKFAGWIQQAIDAHMDAGSFAWVVITQRDRRDALVIVPDRLWGAFLGKITLRYLSEHASIRWDGGVIHVTRLRDLLSYLTPEIVRKLCKEC